RRLSSSCHLEWRRRTMAPNNAEVTPEASRASCTNVSVLVIDDDDDIRTLVQELLETEGYSVASAANGAQALDLLRTLTPGVVLLDLTMPVMDGIEFRRCQLEDRTLAAIPTIVMSAHDRAREKASSLSVAECLEKPLD